MFYLQRREVKQSYNSTVLVSSNSHVSYANNEIIIIMISTHNTLYNPFISGYVTVLCKDNRSSTNNSDE